MSGYVTTGKNDPSQSLQMISRPLMSSDELKALPKGNFIVTKTGTHPIYAADLPHRAVTVFMYLKNRANKDRTCFPAIGTIASDLKLSKRTVERALADLEKAGLLERIHRFRSKGGKSSNLYRLLDDP